MTRYKAATAGLFDATPQPKGHAMHVLINFRDKNQLPWEFHIVNPMLSDDENTTGIPSLAKFHTYDQLRQFLVNCPVKLQPYFTQAVNLPTCEEICQICPNPPQE